jgi:glycosyltransferase involved in cell wall biosynthesis
VRSSASTASAQRDGLRWLDEFERERGRPLRVLHIGNVANNAYNNAKIQRRRGIEADVVCGDYFHIMGCPEWEDAEFEGEVTDPFFPDWWAVDLHGFSRPRWFAQGRLPACQRYLTAARRGERLMAATSWRRLELGRWVACRSTRPARLLRSLVGRQPSVGRHWRLRLARRKLLLGQVARALRARDAGSAASLTAAMFRRARPEEAAAMRTVDDRLPRRWRELFPDRAPLSEDDYAGYLEDLPRWKELLAEYDVVQAYSTDPIIPLLCGIPFTAYEHGTLREIPFQESSVGRVCALGYREAAAVLVTNSDVVPSARRLGISEDRLVFLPHAVDSDRLQRFADAHAGLTPRAGAQVVFLAPSRQDWLDGDPSWAKGNDRAVRALALVRERGLRCRLVLAEWGRHLDDTRRLVEELGVSELVTWMPPLRKQALWEAYLSSHAVLDQFVVPAIGGVAFEAMALGRRVITALDRDAAAAFFGDEPPLLAASEPQAIAAAMVAVIEDPDDDAGLGASAYDWFARYHSADRIVDLQARAYRGILAARVARVPNPPPRLSD